MTGPVGWRTLLHVTVAVSLLGSTEAATAQSRRSATKAETAASGTTVYDVSVRRDRYGVPHILGRTDADAAFGLGFACAEDDFATLQEAVFTGRGRVASINGPGALEGDYLFQLMDIDKTVAERYERDLPVEVRRIVEAYADGINRYAAQHPETVKPGLLPVTGKDIVAGTLYRGPTFAGLDDVFSEVIKGKLPGEKMVGSNAVALAPSRSADGSTRLLYNAHQPFTGQYAWYEAVVQSGQGWHVAGGFFPGAPFLLGGHNAHLGWAATVNRPDLADVYRLTVNPAHPNQYQLDGKWRTFESRFVDIPVKQADGTLKSERKEVLRSAHGPALRTPKGVFAIRYPTSGGVRQLLQNYRMNKARSLAEFKAAMALQALPNINYLYADERGNIGYIHNAIYPERKDGPDWLGVVDGTRSDLIWTKTRPFSQTPQIWNPKSGWLFNANNTPFQATDPAEDLQPSAYPKSMGIQTDMTNRAWRALETYGADTSITAAEWDDYKYDLTYSDKSDTVALVTAVLAADASGDPDLAAIQSVLRGWDRRTDLKNRGAAIPAVSWLLKRSAPNATPVQTVKLAAAQLKKTYGRIDPEWGEVNRLRRGKVDLPVDGGPDIFRAIYGGPDPDGRLRASIGDSYVMFIDWDRSGKLSSRSVHQFGAATLDASSPHYADQAQLFADKKTKPVLFTEAQLAGNIEREYRPGDLTAAAK